MDVVIFVVFFIDWYTLIQGDGLFFPALVIDSRQLMIDPVSRKRFPALYRKQVCFSLAINALSCTQLKEAKEKLVSFHIFFFLI
jgi:hypothetical protein